MKIVYQVKNTNQLVVIDPTDRQSAGDFLMCDFVAQDESTSKWRTVQRGVVHKDNLIMTQVKAEI